MVRRRLPIVIIGLVLICLATIVAGKRLGGDKDVITVDSIKVEPRPFNVAVSAQGVIEPARTVEVRAGITGRVREVYVREGDTVKAGQRLVRFETQDLEAQVQQARAQVVAMEAELAQVESQLAGESGKTLAVQQAETQLQAAKMKLQDLLKGPSEAQIAQAEAQVAQAEIALNEGIRQLEAMEALYEEGAVTKAALEDARARVESAKVQQQAAKKQYEALLEQPSREQVELAEAQVREAEMALAIAKEQEVLKEKSREAVKARLTQANTALRLAESALAKATVTSSENGVVTAVSVKEGAVVTEGMPLVVISASDGMRVRAKVDETDIARVKVGQRVTFSTDAMWGETFFGVVSEIAPQAVHDGITPGFHVLIDVDDPGNDLRSGMSADVEIITYSNENALVVPIQAIVGKDGEDAIFVVDEEDSKARRIKVVIGRTDAIDAEILEGIDIGDQVIIGDYNALRQLEDGKQVRLSTHN